MSLKINGSNISQMKVNGYDIKLAKINGNIVFQKMVLKENLYPVQQKASYTGDGGLDVTFEDKYCLINGTSTSWGYYYTHEFVMNLEANKQYKFKLTLDSGSTNATDQVIIVDLWENGTGIIDFVWLTTETVYNEITFTPSASNSTYVLFLNSIEGVTYNNWKVNISITEA